MISKIQISNYKCLKHINQSISSYQILVGPNGSGKSTFMDVLVFISDILNYGLIDSVYKFSSDSSLGRVLSIEELFYNKEQPEIVFTISFILPESLEYNECEYTLSIGSNSNDDNTIGIIFEKCVAKKKQSAKQITLIKSNKANTDTTNSKVLFERRLDQIYILPSGMNLQNTIDDKHIAIKDPTSYNFLDWLLNNKSSTNREFYYNTDFKNFVSILGFIYDYFKNKVRRIILKDNILKSYVSLGFEDYFDGACPCLPIIIDKMDFKARKNWISHVNQTLPDVKDIYVIKDKLRAIQYFYYKTKNDITIPSWQMSDGTVRFLALTSLAYINTNYCYLIEEPENCLHPKAINDLCDSLKSIYEGQILIATHSPLVLACSKLSDILCFSRSETTHTMIKSAQSIVGLELWKKELSVNELFMNGLLDY